DQVERGLERLHALTDGSAPERIRAAFQSLVPEYMPPDSGAVHTGNGNGSKAVADAPPLTESGPSLADERVSVTAL
ncbi:MAG TPA: hypothetical protein VM925_19970, partial [Labilithrix sp.]|nr:hypothetical protein [Labilithrix sp.]